MEKELRARIVELENELQRERELGKATLAHAEHCADVAVKQALNKARNNIRPIMREFEDFKGLETDKIGQMLMRIITINLENALRASGI